MENTIELKDNTIENMKKKHKNLQDKYIKLCFSMKKQEKDILLTQAKMLKKQKIERDEMKRQNKFLTKLFTSSFPKFTESGLDFEYPRLKTNSNIQTLSLEKEKKEIKEIINKNKSEFVLPTILINNPIKNEENININKDNLVGDEQNRLDEINEKMKKVIEEN